MVALQHGNIGASAVSPVAQGRDTGTVPVKTLFQAMVETTASENIHKMRTASTLGVLVRF